jgi:hypothetical protein
VLSAGERVVWKIAPNCDADHSFLENVGVLSMVAACKEPSSSEQNYVNGVSPMTMKHPVTSGIIGNIPVTLAAVMAVIVFTTVTAWACPRGYVPCGEKGQLCCPQN